MIVCMRDSNLRLYGSRLKRSHHLMGITTHTPVLNTTSPPILYIFRILGTVGLSITHHAFLTPNNILSTMESLPSTIPNAMYHHISQFCIRLIQTPLAKCRSICSRNGKSRRSGLQMHTTPPIPHHRMILSGGMRAPSPCRRPSPPPRSTIAPTHTPSLPLRSTVQVPSTPTPQTLRLPTPTPSMPTPTPPMCTMSTPRVAWARCVACARLMLRAARTWPRPGPHNTLC